MEDYIVVSKKWLEERAEYDPHGSRYDAGCEAIARIILGEAKSLQPLLEHAFEAGMAYERIDWVKSKEEYLETLKID